jgi:hypothetical protein
MKIHAAVGAYLFHVERQTDMTELIDSFRNFVNVLQNGMKRITEIKHISIPLPATIQRLLVELKCASHLYILIYIYLSFAP